MGTDIKKFAVKLILVLAILFFVDTVAGVGLKTLFYKQKSGKYYKISHAIKNANEDILIFGSSHASEHFNVPLIQQLTHCTAFNFGNQGQSLLYIYPLVKSAVIHHKPKIVIVNLDYEELAYKAEAYERLSIFLPYYNNNQVIDSAIALMPNNESLKCQSFLYRYNSTLGNILLNTYNKQTIKNSVYLGYEPFPGNICNIKLDEPIPQSSFALDKNKINYLMLLINLLQSNHIKLIVTSTPTFYNTSGLLPHNKLKQILAKYHVPYFDGTNDIGFKNKCQYFADDTHLNPTGADKWSAMCSTYITTKML